MAIAFDAATDGGSAASPSPSVSWAHTCTGAQRMLWIWCYGDVSSDLLSSVQYNGVACTFVKRVDNFSDASGSGRFFYVYYLVNPAAGTHNVTLTYSSTPDFGGGMSVSYTGASASGQPDNTKIQYGSGATGSENITITPVADNCWTLMFNFSNFFAHAAGTGSTQRIDGGGVGQQMTIMDSNGPIHPAALHGMTVDFDASESGARSFMVSMSPDTGGGGSTFTLSLSSYI